MRGQTLAFETLLLPLETSNGNYHRILGSTSPADRPYWLGVHPILEQEIVSLRMIWPNEMQQPELVSAPEEQVRPEPPAIAVDPESGSLARRFGHLLVYEGGKQKGPSDIGA